MSIALSARMTLYSPVRDEIDQLFFYNIYFNFKIEQTEMVIAKNYLSFI